jgi:NADPH2:quinone reductase
MRDAMINKMKAAVVSTPGGPEALEIKHVDLPWPASNSHVLVRLKAASLNPADSYFRAFGPYVEDGRPCILGHDGAGVVEEIGSGVSRVQPGQRVCFCNGGIGGDFGTYAEFAVVPESQLALVPDAVDDATAAGLPLTFITGWESLYDRAQLKAGEFALIHAGAGGTGHIAVQLAALRGARVAATVSTDAKADFVSELGTERPILYRDEDFVAASLEWSDDQGLDVALDNIGPEGLQKTFGAMAAYGRVVTLMGTPGDDDEETAYVKNLTIHNVMMLTPMILKLQARLDEQARIVANGLRLLAEGKLRVTIDQVFPFSEISAAHARLDAGGTTGKIVINIAD